MFTITIEDFDRLLLLAEARADKIGYDIDHDPRYCFITEIITDCGYYNRSCDVQERRDLISGFYYLFERLDLDFFGEL